jgi:para-nitrobenzyl esterase
VWIHGGGFVRGATSDPRFNGAWLASQGIVAVTISYRLGALSAPPPIPAFMEGNQAAEGVNFGLMDQMEALSWVQANIAAFGGDPAQVTIAGSSAGGASVGYLSTTPAARGLFARSIMMSSGGGDRKPSYQPAAGEWPRQFQKVWQAVLDGAREEPCAAPKDAGVKSGTTLGKIEQGQGLATALRLCLPAEKIVTAFGNSWNSSGGLLKQEYRSYPFFDGTTVAAPSQIDGFKQAAAPELPLLIGFARDEATEVSSRGLALRQKDLVRRLRNSGLDFIRSWKAVAKLYPEPEGNMALARRVYADVTYHWPAQIAACLLARTSDNVHVYEFNYTSPQRKRDPDLGAGHSEDAIWLFGGPVLDAAVGKRAARVADRDGQFVASFSTAVLNFVKSGNPNPAGAAESWPAYVPGMNVMLIDGPKFVLKKAYDSARLPAIKAMAKTYGVSFEPDGCRP